MEEWRVIPGYETHEASSLGRIRNKTTGKILNQTRYMKGFRHVKVQCKEIPRHRSTVHRLVCLAFHGPQPFAGARALHRDDVADNNTPGNLRWGTQVQNYRDARLNGRTFNYKHGRYAKEVKNGEEEEVQERIQGGSCS